MTATQERVISSVRRLAYLLDNSIHIPFINYRIGLDPIMGLIPGVGDAAGLIIASYIIMQAARLGVPKRTLLLMVYNAVIEAVVGIIPILGNLFDATYKANTRNIYLLERHVDPHTPLQPPSNRRLKLLLGLLLFLILGGLITLILGVYGLLQLFR